MVFKKLLGLEGRTGKEWLLGSYDYVSGVDLHLLPCSSLRNPHSACRVVS